MFNTEEYKGKVGPVFYIGWNKAKIESVTVREASTGRKQLIFRVYGEPVVQEGFKPFSKPDGSTYEGQCGTVVTNYFKDNDPAEVGPIMTRIIKPILNAFGVKEVYDTKVDANTSFDSWMTTLNELLTGPELPYVWMNFNGEEYVRPGKDRPGIRLTFKTITNDEEYKKSVPAGALKKLPVETEDSSSGSLY